MNKSNTAAAAKGLTTAKRKTPTKAEQKRNATDKALASAAKKVAGTTYGDALASYVRGHDEAESRKRVMAMFLNNLFAEEMKEFRCHWSDIYDSKNARNADNMKAIWERIDEKRQEMKQYCIDNRKSLSNTDKPWGDAKREAKAIFLGTGGQRAPRQTKAFPDMVKAAFLTLYKSTMKEAFPSELDMRLGKVIGDVLTKEFKVDLSEY
jgi:hypothetical protein